MVRDCIYSALHKDGRLSSTQLIKRNCKTNEIHLEVLSKYGRKQDGHLFMFEAIAFEDDAEHFVTCDVDVCLRGADGKNLWPGCYQECDNKEWFDFDAFDSFQLTTTTELPTRTEPPETTASRFTLEPSSTAWPKTFTTATTPDEPSDDLYAARRFCAEKMRRGDFHKEQDENAWTLCQYIMQRFPRFFWLKM